MKNIKYVNKVFRLKKPMVVNLNGIPEPLSFKLGEEFHIVTDVLYMNGTLLPPPFQEPIINWVESNPNLFVDDTRQF
jgi:hypothetical protein